MPHAGFGMVGVLASLAVIAVLSAIALSSLGGTGTGAGIPGAGGPAGSASAGPGGLVGQARDTAAQQNLDTALSVADQVALSSGYGDLDAPTLAAQSAGIGFTSAPSTGPQQITVAAGGGGVTLGARTGAGTCWFVWRSEAATFYGVEHDQPSCVAPALAAPPAAGAVASGTIDWQQGSFPS